MQVGSLKNFRFPIFALLVLKHNYPNKKQYSNSMRFFHILKGLSMKNMICFKQITLLASLLICFAAYAQNSDEEIVKSLNKRSITLKNRTIKLHDVKTVQQKDWEKLFPIPEHPAFDSLLTKEKEAQLLKEINQRRLEVRKDTLLTSDIFYIWKPYFNWLQYIDPHCRIFYLRAAPESKMKIPEFTYLLINDTIIVNTSFVNTIKKGDMILSINKIPMSEYLKYSYTDRIGTPYMLMRNYYYFKYTSDNIDISLIRNGQPLEIKIPGTSIEEWEKISKKPDYNIQTFHDAKCGYINVQGFFDDNKSLIKTIHSSVKKFKKQGYSNIIIDLRENPGGSGDSFDKLMSIFINKPAVLYQKGAKLKVSKKVLPDYDFLTEEMIGKLVDLPDSEFIKEFKTMPDMYVDGMNYYILVSTNTGSMAVTFANILQYNNAAKLVGEALLHNAYKFGDVIKGGILQGEDFTPTFLGISAVSTVEYDEYTKAIDGVILPDIHIPYVAKDYLAGKDAMLEKLLLILKQKR